MVLATEKGPPSFLSAELPLNCLLVGTPIKPLDHPMSVFSLRIVVILFTTLVFKKNGLTTDYLRGIQIRSSEGFDH